ncbi:hypothetical protein [Paenibacillus koleovorans]|uniref:hypothetical protein n=1 Tax=Paenibacillus koleovorans TaxID=121608 RepID=UPI000FD8BCD6|nr:hypothetical protein [Paenibacillus koleovorans]
MFRCAHCSKVTDLQWRNCAHCGKVIDYTVAEKFDMLAESVEAALKKELQNRKKNKIMQLFSKRG